MYAYRFAEAALVAGRLPPCASSRSASSSSVTPPAAGNFDAFFCTDVSADAGFILTAYARRWSLEVTFHDTKQFLGLAEPQCQSPQAVQRTTPEAIHLQRTFREILDAGDRRCAIESPSHASELHRLDVTPFAVLVFPGVVGVPLQPPGHLACKNFTLYNINILNCSSGLNISFLDDINR